MRVYSLLSRLGLCIMLLGVYACAISVPKSSNAIQSRSQIDTVGVAAHAGFRPRSQTSVRVHSMHSVTSRGFKTVPDVPYPWKAVFTTTTSVQPVDISAKLLRGFYLQVVQSVLPGIDDRWQHTFQMGHIMLAITSRNRKEDLVTRELITAVCFMLNEFAKGGFSDLFFATLWHDLEGLAVDIQLMIMNRAAEGMRVT
ncbi:MAG: hypothetical protein Q9222_007344 [Ikaeria aurantiellina]